LASIDGGSRILQNASKYSISSCNHSIASKKSIISMDDGKIKPKQNDKFNNDFANDLGHYDEFG